VEVVSEVLEVAVALVEVDSAVAVVHLAEVVPVVLGEDQNERSR